jgi:hypothetical protein
MEGSRCLYRLRSCGGSRHGDQLSASWYAAKDTDGMDARATVVYLFVANR